MGRAVDVDAAIWARYDSWNRALAKVVFGEDASGRPAYLNLEDEVIAAVADEVGELGEPAPLSLALTVRTRLDLTPNHSPFEPFVRRLRTWLQGDRTQPPPVVAVLAVLSLAAEAMNAGDGFASTNYYVRLRQLLRLSADEADQVERSYRKVDAQLWGALNGWLDSLDGKRGISTAYAMGSYRHVGLPLSQALIRAVDRRCLPNLFSFAGLGPGEAIGIDDLLGVIDAWLQDSASPASPHLRRLWRRDDPDLQERIANVVALELESWTGGLSSEDTRTLPSSRARLTALLSHFPAARLEVGLTADDVGLHGQPSAVLTVVGGSLQIDAVGLLQNPDGGVRVDGLWAVPRGDVLGRALRLTGPGDSSVVHNAKPLYVFVRDRATQVYEERDRVVLGVDVVLIGVERIESDVLRTLNAIARPGFRRWSSTTLEGLPDGWILYSEVQVMAVPKSGELTPETQVLMPSAGTQLTLGGGLALPGAAQRWSSLSPPEIRASTDASAEITITLKPAGVDVVAFATSTALEFTSMQPAIVVSLSDQGLEDGDYEIRAVSGRGHILARRTLRLRSASSASIDDGEPLVGYRPDVDASGTLSTSRFGAGPPLISGLTVEAIGHLADAAPRRRVPSWLTGETPRVQTPEPQVNGSASASCTQTGFHVWLLPQVTPGTRASRQVVGVCQGCALTKSYPATWSALRRIGKQSEDRHRLSVLVLDTTKLPPIRIDSGLRAAAADALVFLGHGSARDFATVIGQVEQGPLFAAEFRRQLEAIGMIDCELDDRMRLNAWRVPSAVLSELGNGDVILAGRVNRTMADAVLGAASARKAVAAISHFGEADAVVIEAAPGGMAVDIAEEFRALLNIGLSRSTAERLISILPPISAVLRAIPFSPIPAYRHAWRFDARSGEWREIDRVRPGGGYRLEGFGVSYVIALPDRDDSEVLHADAGLVRFAAALLDAEPIVALDDTNGTVALPLGTHLPGLYGRAAFLAAGGLPTRLTSRAGVAYPSMPASLAEHLVRLLES